MTKRRSFYHRMFTFSPRRTGWDIPPASVNTASIVSIVMSKYLLLIVLSVLAISCKSKKVSPGSEDDEVTVPEFIHFFRPLPTPYTVTDTILRRKEPETALIHYNLFARLLPDTLLTRYFGKDIKPRLYAVGKIKASKAESYLFVKGVTSTRRILFVLVFDKKDHFSAARPVIYSDNEAGISGLSRQEFEVIFVERIADPRIDVPALARANAGPEVGQRISGHIGVRGPRGIR